MDELYRITSDDPDLTIHKVVLGDFNLDWSDSATKHLMSQLFLGLRQLGQQVTTDYHSTLDLHARYLDHVYTTILPDDINCFIIESYFTDHKPVILSLPLH